MIDPTESPRRHLLAEINAAPGSREYLEAKHGQVWDTDQLQEDFDVLGFAAPLVVGRRKADGVKGSLDVPGLAEVLFRLRAASGLIHPVEARPRRRRRARRRRGTDP
jgi:hypothetical protein